MSATSDLSTIQALRGDVALQISRFLARQQLSQAAAAKQLRIPQPTISKIVNGRVAELSLELLIRIAVRAGLQLVLQTGAVPEEAGAFLSGAVSNARQGTPSKLADDAREALLTTARDMTAEQRLQAHVKHSELLTSLHRAGRRSR
ncbi:MAG TPA: XRE family transcriptional regulator [Steroidobacteraceae bacterium]|nr:XRE family transcriptional regulator [Steroidobacteraceae bacterium]